MPEDIKAEQESGKTVKFNDPIGHIVDADWLETAFIVKVESLQEEKIANIFSSYADRYFLDTSYGGNVAINPHYQFTRYADIPRKGRMAGRDDVDPRSESYDLGMGRYYAKAIESNTDALILEFGVPEFISIFSFFTRAIDYNRAVVANEGRSTFFYDIGKGLGYAAQFIALNVTTVMIYAGIGLFKTMYGNGDNRYYHMKPAMVQYWKIVNSLVTYMATDRGMLSPILMDGHKDRLGMPIKIDSEMENTLHAIMPEVFSDNGYIDVFAIAQRSQVLINNQLLAEMKTFREGRFTKAQIDEAINGRIGKLRENVSYDNFVKELQNNKMYSEKREDDRQVPELESTPGDPEEYMRPDDDWTLLKLPVEKLNNYMENLAQYTYATMRRGGATVVLNVEHVGSITDSFSNSVKDIPTKDAVNGLGGAARDIRFSLSGGNIMGDVVQDITNAAKDVAMGTLDTLTFGLSNVIAGLMGGGNIDMPKMWADSSCNIAKVTYKITAAPPYGHPIAKIMDLDLVLAIILAGMLPQSVGQSSYTSPFLCKAFLRGRQNIDFGMITDCSITRGINNVPYDKDGKTLGLEISFTITDFSELIAAPVHPSLFGATDISLDENNPLNRYLSTLVGRDYHTSRYAGKNALLTASRKAMGVDAFTSPAYMGMLAGDTFIGRFISTLGITDISALYLKDQD